MRLLRFILPLVLLACTNGGGDETEDTDTPQSNCSDNPNIPEGYECLWGPFEEGCTSSGGAPGRQVYWMFEGETDAEGNISGTETYWWFFPEEWGEDCVDKLSLQGKSFEIDGALLSCVQCDEFYKTDRAVTEDNCHFGYSILFEEDQAGFHQTLMLDTLNPNGEPQEDNNVLVNHRTTDRRGNPTTEKYAEGTLTPLGDVHGPPAKLTWLGSKCMGR